MFFADSIARGDIEAVFSVMDAQAAGEKGDCRALAEHLRVVFPASSLLMPGDIYAAYAPINQSRIRAQQGSQIYGFIASLLVPEWDPSLPAGIKQEGTHTTITLGDATMNMDDFIARLDPTSLASLTLRQVLRLDSHIARSETNQANIHKRGGFLGFTDQANLLVIYTLGDQPYSHTYTAVLRPEGWQLSGLSSPIQNTSAYGNAEAITADEAARLINSPDYLLLFDAENQ